EIICTALSRDGKEYDSTTVYPTFTRNIPQNLLDLVSSVVQLQGIVPNEELLGLLPFIDDVEYALDKLREEKEENMEAGYGMFDLGGTEETKSNKFCGIFLVNVGYTVVESYSLPSLDNAVHIISNLFC